MRSSARRRRGLWLWRSDVVARRCIAADEAELHLFRSCSSSKQQLVLVLVVVVVDPWRGHQAHPTREDVVSTWCGGLCRRGAPHTTVPRHSTEVAVVASPM